jgi:AcrR family transcriptional regulator
MTKPTHNYHHGDLQSALLSAASKRIEELGIDGLSLRKLAEDVGVSRSALYHHFKDKNALLSAIAAQGFERWLSMTKHTFSDTNLSEGAALQQFVKNYVGWAAAHPTLYDLMFGRPIWKTGTPSDSLKNVAYPAFQFLVSMATQWQATGLLPSTEEPLRLAQVFWATLHGLARLLIDGIYADANHLEDMCDAAVHVFMGSNNT